MTCEPSDTAVEGASSVASAVPAPGTGSEAPRPATGVVVGVDDSQSARAAVAWAAVAADHRGVGLDLVEVLPGASPRGTTTDAAVTSDTAHGRARALLSRAQGIARSTCPELPISMHTRHGKVAAALVDHAANAELLVVGSNGPGGPIPVSLGSIVGGVTRQCPCPVVLVPAASSSSRTQTGPVVVALEDTPDGERALAFAAEAAHRRNVSLVPLVDAGSESVAPTRPLSSESALLTSIRQRYPELVVQPQTITERPAQALLRSDAEAQLIVVPSVGRRASRSSSTSGWTGHFLPILSACPVAVVSARTLPSTSLA